MEYLDFWKNFCRAEQDSKAYDMTVLGFQIYTPLRVRLYYQAAKQLGIFSDPHPSRSNSELAEVGLNPIGEYRYFVIPFTRKLGGVDPYSQPFLRLVGDQGYLLEEANSNAEMDLVRIRKFAKRNYLQPLDFELNEAKVAAAAKHWSEIAAAMNSRLGVSLGKFDEFPLWYVRRHISEARAFAHVFSSAAAQQLFLVNAYSLPSVVVGAKLAGVRVTEIQHGFLSSSHPAYAHQRKEVQVAADRILSWGPYWSKHLEFAKGVKVEVTGPGDQLRGLEKQTANPKTILFTSQGAIGRKLIHRAIAWAKALTDYQITFRLHPNESLDYYQQLELPENLTLSHKEPLFPELLKSHAMIAGVFSTTIFEGIHCGLKAVVFPLSGYENALPAIRRGDINLVPKKLNSKDVRGFVEGCRHAKKPSDYYQVAKKPSRALLSAR
jgi:hypothetical protein